MDEFKRDNGGAERHSKVTSGYSREKDELDRNRVYNLSLDLILLARDASINFRTRPVLLSKLLDRAVELALFSSKRDEREEGQDELKEVFRKVVVLLRLNKDTGIRKRCFRYVSKVL